MNLPILRTADDLAALVDEVGFLPFFRGKVPGFSVADCTPPELWFTSEEGPWEWKGPVIEKSGCAYGKFFRGKAGYISRRWFPDFANYRRDGYDFDAAYDDGLASFLEKQVFEALDSRDSMLSKDLKRASGFVGESQKGFDAVLTRLQGRCYVVTANFEYSLDKHGQPYGWGLARYATPERLFGEDFTGRVYSCKPEESAVRILEHLERLLPDATQAQLKSILG